MLQLVRPSKEYLRAFLKAVDDYRSDENHFGRGGIDPMIKAIDDNKVDEYFQKVIDEAKGKNLKEGYVPETRFWLIDGNEFIGSFGIRHWLTPNLEKIGGHIAVNIAPQHRGKYSSFIGMKMCLAKASEMGLRRVLLTCDERNQTSYRAISGLRRMYGGQELPDSVVDGHGEHRVWVNTPEI